MNLDQSIPCPVCNNKIPFDQKQLLMGVKYICSSCGSEIGLAIESKGIVKETMKKYEEIKNKSLKKGGNK